MSSQHITNEAAFCRIVELMFGYDSSVASELLEIARGGGLPRCRLCQRQLSLRAFYAKSEFCGPNHRNTFKARSKRAPSRIARKTPRNKRNSSTEHSEAEPKHEDQHADDYRARTDELPSPVSQTTSLS